MYSKFFFTKIKSFINGKVLNANQSNLFLISIFRCISVLLNSLLAKVRYLSEIKVYFLQVSVGFLGYITEDCF